MTQSLCLPSHFPPLRGRSWAPRELFGPGIPIPPAVPGFLGLQAYLSVPGFGLREGNVLDRGLGKQRDPWAKP